MQNMCAKFSPSTPSSCLLGGKGQLVYNGRGTMFFWQCVILPGPILETRNSAWSIYSYTRQVTQGLGTKTLL